MSRSRLSLKFRVRYEGLVQTFDRRPKKEIESDPFESPIRRMVAQTLAQQWPVKSKKSIFRLKK